MTANDHPADDVLEISVFGKGYGESIAVHVGDGRWIVIDSVSAGTGSVVRTYFEAIGVDLVNQVDLIVATHWHDDHVRGIANLFEVCENSEFIFPAAMLDDEFVKFAAAFNGQVSKKFSSGVQEFGKVIELAMSRKKPGSKWPLRLGANGFVAYRKAPNTFKHGFSVSLEALSPSHYDLQKFISAVTGVAPTPRVLQRAPFHGRNDVSCAMWLQVGENAILFGADVETGSHSDSGWNAIVSSSTLPWGKADLVKVPHHGGKSGHHSDMWFNLASPKPLATLTPWSKGGNRLPTKDDVERITALTRNGYATGPSVLGKEANQPSVVSKVLKKDNITLKRVSTDLGHVRHRASIQEAPFVWDTQLFGRACALSAMAA